MEAVVICSRGTAKLQFDGSESSLWEGVGKMLRWIPAPDQITVIVGEQKAELDVTEDGVKPLSNDISVARSKYGKKWLTKVDPETNSYAFYKMIPHTMGPVTFSFGGSFGRIGASKGDLSEETVIKKPVPSWLFWIRYYEKMNKGYHDAGDEMFSEDSALYSMFAPLEETADEKAEDDVVELWKKLRDCSKDAVSSQLNVDLLSEEAPFTRRQVDKGWGIWKTLGKSKSVDDFNDKVMKLMAISPRKIDQYRGMSVKSFLAPVMPTTEEQEKVFADIIAREESLLQAMDAVVGAPVSKTSEKRAPQMFGDAEVTVADEKDSKWVISRMSPELQPKVAKVYKVTPKQQSEMFNEYVEQNGITEKKFFWHGSRNENWLSIISKSLMLNPNAVITGKMWGCGIYFAPSSMKSWGYTSARGARWTSGTSDLAFMGLYETAYGNPYFPQHIENGSAALLAKHHANCLHAKKDVCGLMNDEVVFFDEKAICLRYLVEFN